jgi:predicted nucleotidyltransferase
MDIELPPDFKEFLKLLHVHKVKYLLIGGYAVGYHGYARATNDIDFWVSSDPTNAERIVAMLKDFGFDTPNLSTAMFTQANSMVRMGVKPLMIELTTTISGVDFDECYANRIVEDMDGVEVNLIDLRHLLINKKASGRNKDLDDLEHLS